MNSNIIAISNVQQITYPGTGTLFRPSQFYPEYPFSEVSKEKNEVYDAVRNALNMLEMDISNYGSSKWNPFGDIIKQGNSVLIKPNMVMDINHNRGGGIVSLYTAECSCCCC